MTLYAGLALELPPVSLTAPDTAETQRALGAAEIEAQQTTWLARSSREEDCLYFAVRASGRLVGQIMLHDIDAGRRVALVGYHIFRGRDRRQGYGTAALRLLCDYALGELHLRRLVAITGRENIASQALALTAGFRCTGTAREGPHLLTYELTAERRQNRSPIE